MCVVVLGNLCECSQRRRPGALWRWSALWLVSSVPQQSSRPCHYSHPADPTLFWVASWQTNTTQTQHNIDLPLTTATTHKPFTFLLHRYILYFTLEIIQKGLFTTFSCKKFPEGSENCLDIRTKKMCQRWFMTSQLQPPGGTRNSTLSTSSRHSVLPKQPKSP